MRRMGWGIGAVLIVLAAGVPPAGAAPGDLDPSFGGDGIALSGLQDLDEFNAEFDVAVQADGKVVVVGNDANNVLVVRFGTDGELDPTFSDDGVATIDFDPTRPADNSADAVGIDSQGRIVVGGRVSGRGFGVARLTPDGDRDTDFSGDGRVVVPGGPMSRMKDLVIDDTDRIVLAGWQRWCHMAPGCFEADGSRIVVLRFTATGQPDPSFSGDGFRALQPTGHDSASAVGLTPEGRILVVGQLGPRPNPSPRPRLADQPAFVLRLWPWGRVDKSFGRGGWAVVNLVEGSDHLGDLEVGEDGTLTLAGLAAGNRRVRMALVRLEADGRFDRGFSDDGRLLQDLGRGDEWGTGVATDSEGRIVVGGTIRVGADDQRGVVLRYLADGALDPTFSGNGWVAVDAAPSPEWGDGLALDADGRAVLGLRTLDRVGAARVLTG